MEKTVKLLIILFLFFILPKYLFSETQDILEIDIYPKTSITSYKPIPLSNVLPSVTIINNDTIEKSNANNLTDLLKAVPGIEVTENGGYGSVTSIFARGQNSVNIVILVDGVQSQVDNYGGKEGLNIPKSMIERVEILRGNSSALYGSYAIGGVINVITKKGAGGGKPFASVKYGSYNSYELNGGYSVANENGEFFINALKFNTDGFSSCNQIQKPNCNSDNDGADQEDLILKYGKKFSSKFDVNLNAKFSELNNDTDSTFGSASDTHRLENSSNNYGITSNFKNKNFLSKIIFEKSNLEKKQFKNGSQETKANGGLHDGKQDLINWKNGYDFDIGYSRNSMMIGLEKLDSERESYNTKFQQNNMGYYLGYTGVIKNFDFQINFRDDNNEIKSQNGESKSFSKTTDLYGIGYYITDQIHATFTQSSAFRSPLGTEVFTSSGNLNLQPEENKSNEYGIEYLGKNLNSTLSIFETESTNAISYAYKGPGPFDYSYFNTAIVKIKGYEFTLDKFFIDSKISGSYVLQDIDTSESTRYRKRAKHYGKLSYERRFLNWDTNIYLKTSGSRDDGQKLSPYNKIDINASRKIGDNLLLTFSSNNVTNTKYQTTYGFNVPERSYYLKLSYERE